jgi:hypothetical protein
MKDPNWSHSGKIYELHPSLPGAPMSSRRLRILCRQTTAVRFKFGHGQRHLIMATIPLLIVMAGLDPAIHGGPPGPMSVS